MIHPTHHPPIDIMQEYVAGTLSPAFGLGIEIHLSLCSQCCEKRALLEQVGGAVLSMGGKAPLSSGLQQKIMAALEDLATDSEMAKSGRALQTQPLQDGDIVLPRALSQILRAAGVDDLTSLKWRKIGGYGEADLPLPLFAKKATEIPPGTFEDAPRVRLLRLAPGAVMPRHTHKGKELTLVLHGGFKDSAGNYEVGDLIFADSDIDHAPEAHYNGPCLCLAITDGPLHLTGPIGKWLNPYLSL